MLPITQLENAKTGQEKVRKFDQLKETLPEKE